MNIHSAPTCTSLRAAGATSGSRSRALLSSGALPCSRTSCCSFLRMPATHFTAEGTTRSALPTREELATEIFNLPRPFDDRRFQNRRLQPVTCTLRVDATVQAKHEVNDSVFDVREPSNVHSATLHAAMTLGEDSCRIRAVKIEFELDGALEVGAPTSNGRARIFSASDGVWVTDLPNQERLFRFMLDSVDTSIAPARSTGGFKLMARKRGDDRLLFVEGTFGLREFDA